MWFETEKEEADRVFKRQREEIEELKALVETAQHAPLATMRENGKPERRMCSVCNMEIQESHLLTQCIEVFRASEMKAIMLSVDARRDALDEAADLCQKMIEKVIAERGHLRWTEVLEELRQQILALKGK